MVKHFLHILDVTEEEAHTIVRRAHLMKKYHEQFKMLNGKTIILLFEKASTRTRISFEVAIDHLGGNSIFMTPGESQLGRNEPLRDTARILSGYAEGLVVRTYGQEKLHELAEFGSIPVINALTDEYHPCQVMSDILTIYEHTPDFSMLRVAWVGDGNNMAHSWINAAIYFPFELRLAVPKGYEPNGDILENALNKGARIKITEDPQEAVHKAHYVNTDVWASMGQEEEQAARKNIFAPYQVNDSLLKNAHKEVKVLHCLPAHRGEEITDDVMEGQASLVWEQAENRLHMQKAILEWIYSE